MGLELDQLDDVVARRRRSAEETGHEHTDPTEGDDGERDERDAGGARHGGRA
jgi:hypothetical protein